MSMEDYLPPGFRFYPIEEELVSFYLHNKLEGSRPDLNPIIERVIPVLDIYDFHPWDLPHMAGEVCRSDLEQWFFFIPRQEREARGGRPNRLTDSGYWKATGCPGYVFSSSSRIIGVKRTMVFYEGRAPSGRKTEWKMNEYKAIDGEFASSSSSATAPPKLRHEFSLCRVYKKSKSMRSFDRRPPGDKAAESSGHAHVDQAQPSHSYQQQNLSYMINRTGFSSPDSSPSRGQHAHSTSSEMAVDDEHLWDWEQLNWF